MGRWARSKQLAKASWGVLREAKSLMVLPIISGIASLFIAASFALPMFLTTDITDAGGADGINPSALTYVLGFFAYLALAYIAIFFKTAMLCGADQQIRGDAPSVGSAISGASAHAGKILPWAIVTATVSVILRSLEERAGLLGRIVIGFVGVAWAAVTFLVLPVLVFEGVGVVDAVKRSGNMLKQTWGENLLVNMGIGLITMLLVIPGVLVAVGAALTGSIPLAIVGITLGVTWIIGVVCWSSAMSAVFQLALYRFATNLEMPAQFAAVDLSHAFRHKKGGVI
jgi:hypothetical protein